MCAKQIQFRGGTTAQHSTFTGAVRELTVDTDKDTVVVHDGATVGGFPLARESALNAHISDTTDAHAASAVTNTPAGSIAATTVQAAINELDSEKAPLVSPALTGTPTAPTAVVGTNTTQVATTEFVQAEIANDTFSKTELTMAIGNIMSPLLDMPLKNSLVMKAGVGSATFTRASTATYIDRYGVLKTAAIDEPRFEKEGYLNEGSSTNLQLYSNGLSTDYTIVRGTLSFNTVNTLDPYGTNLAAEFLETTTVGGTYIYENRTFTAGTTYTQSIFAKSINGQNIKLSGFGTMTGFSANLTAEFDLANGTILYDTSGTAKIIALSSGWYRCSITGTCATTTTSNYIVASMTVDYASTSYGLYIFGAQLEALPFATSYIPTTSATVTRSADSLLVTRGGNFPDAQNNSEGFSVVFDYDTYGANSMNQYIWSIASVFDNQVSGYLTSGLSLRNFIGNSTGRIFNSLTPSNPLGGRVVQIQSSSQLREYFNGVLLDSDTNTTGKLGETTNSLASITIGGYTPATTSNLYGHIKNFKVYDFPLTAQEVALA